MLVLTTANATITATMQNKDLFFIFSPITIALLVELATLIYLYFFSFVNSSFMWNEFIVCVVITSVVERLSSFVIYTASKPC